MKNLELLNRLLNQKLIDFDEERKNSHEKYDVVTMKEQTFKSQLLMHRADLQSHKSRTSEVKQFIREVHSENMCLQASAVPPGTHIFAFQGVSFGMNRQEAMIESQKGR